MKSSPKSQFRWDSFQAYLFDIDGTLLNSRDGVHYNAFHAALESVFRVRDRIETVPVHGNTDPAILRAVTRKAEIPEETFVAGLPRALEYMRQSALQNCGEMRPEVCPGVRAVLDGLRSRSKLLGLVSGNLEAIGWAKLRAAGLRDYFAFGSFSDQRESRRDIFAHGVAGAQRRLGSENASVCIVGDTPSDIMAARECGLPVIAVATGPYAMDPLRAQSPDLCLSCCGDLLNN